MNDKGNKRRASLEMIVEVDISVDEELCEKVVEVQRESGSVMAMVLVFEEEV